MVLEELGHKKRKRTGKRKSFLDIRRTDTSGLGSKGLQLLPGNRRCLFNDPPDKCCLHLGY